MNDLSTTTDTAALAARCDGAPLAVLSDMLGEDAATAAREHLPEHMHGGLARWVALGIWPGSFLAAVIANDLSRAVGKADAQNLAAIPAWVRWLHNDAPSLCWGSPSRADDWHTGGGLYGRRRG